MATSESSCPSCGERVVENASFCEACGQDLSRPATGALAVSANPPVACASCGSTSFDKQADGGTYCENCGTRRPTGRNHAESDLGVIAAVSDIGKRHHQNEDGYALAMFPQVYVGVICDGVSSSGRSDTASHPAAEAAARAFLRVLGTDGIDVGGLGTAGMAKPDAMIAEAATIVAVGAAQAAAADAGGTVTDPSGPRRANPPSSTFVSAVVTPDAVTIGWIGDSRAYWLGDNGESAGLTVDDTLGEQLAAAGVEMSEDAPNAAALIRWLGADATDTAPHVSAFTPSGPGRVIVCSDGLYRYAAEPAELAKITPAASPIQTAQALVQFALDAGGGDNVTVVVLPYPPI